MVIQQEMMAYWIRVVLVEREHSGHIYYICLLFRVALALYDLQDNPGLPVKYNAPQKFHLKNLVYLTEGRMR